MQHQNYGHSGSSSLESFLYNSFWIYFHIIIVLKYLFINTFVMIKILKLLSSFSYSRCKLLSYSQGYYASNYEWFLFYNSLVPKAYLALQPGLSSHYSGNKHAQVYSSDLAFPICTFTLLFLLFFKIWLKSHLFEDNFTDSDIKLYFVSYYLSLLILL